jgi:glycine/D-amino acid oxidase-like deaminating enzyme
MAAAPRVLIIGAGVTGLVAAVRFARAGWPVTVLDRGRIPNPVGASFDQHRVIRALAPADLAATRRAATLRARWLALESLLDAAFYRRVGAVCALPEDQAEMALSTARAAGLNVSLVAPSSLPLVRFPADSVGLLEHDGGVLMADRVLHAAARWLRRLPEVRVCPGQEAKAIDSQCGRVTLADGRVIAADLVLVATGPWSRDLVDLPVVLHRQTMVYLRPPADLASRWDRSPAVGGVGRDGRAWLAPPGQGSLLKISSDAVCRDVPSLDYAPRDDARIWTSRLLREPILTDAHRYTFAGAKQCHYVTDAESGSAHLIQLGPNVWSRTAAGDDGFRTAPLVAERIAQAMAA